MDPPFLTLNSVTSRQICPIKTMFNSRFSDNRDFLIFNFIPIKKIPRFELWDPYIMIYYLTLSSNLEFEIFHATKL